MAKYPRRSDGRYYKQFFMGRNAGGAKTFYGKPTKELDEKISEFFKSSQNHIIEANNDYTLRQCFDIWIKTKYRSSISAIPVGSQQHRGYNEFIYRSYS